MRKQTAIKHWHQILERAIGQMFKCTGVTVDGACSSVGHYESCTPIHFGPNHKTPHTTSLVQFPVLQRSYFFPHLFQAVRVQSNSGFGLPGGGCFLSEHRPGCQGGTCPTRKICPAHAIQLPCFCSATFST